MSNYNKFFVSIASVLLMRWLLRWAGLDISALGVEDDFRMFVQVGIDAVTAGVTGFFVWLVPNVKHVLHLETDVTLVEGPAKPPRAD